MSRALLTFTAVLLAACSLEVVPEPGQQACGPAGECPKGYTCAEPEHRCWRNGAVPVRDAGTEAAAGDGAPADAAPASVLADAADAPADAATVDAPSPMDAAADARTFDAPATIDAADADVAPAPDVADVMGPPDSADTGPAQSDGPPRKCWLPPDPEDCPSGSVRCGHAKCDIFPDIDANNCGACGRTCGPGGVCRKGECAPVPVATDQRLHGAPLVTASAKGVFWGTSDGNVMRSPLEGGPLETLATGEGKVWRIGVDDDFVYIVTEDGKCFDNPQEMGWCLRRIPIVMGTAPERTLVPIGQYSGAMAAG